MTPNRLLRILRFCLVLVFSVSCSQQLGRAGETSGPPDPKDVEQRAKNMEDSGRDTRLKPEQVLTALQLKPGQTVADIGSGPGYFALRFARAVGPTGRVYGVDIEPHFLAELERLAKLSGLPNVFPVLAKPDDPDLPASSCDLVFFGSAYSRIANRVGYLKRLRSCLKPGGRIAIIDWKKIASLPGNKRSTTKMGPPDADRIDPEQVGRELLEAGFSVTERHKFLEYHFFLVAGARD